MTIIDVRSPEEYQSGHAENSINIPLQQLKDRLKEIQSFAKPIVLCCASGNRSGQATAFLTSNGVDCTNGGCWEDVGRKLKNN